MVSARSKQLTLATYNIFIRSDPKKIASNISTMLQRGVDIFCLQEVLKTKGKPFVGDEIQSLLGTTWKLAYCLGNENTYLDHGIAMIWNARKLKLLDTYSALLPKLQQVPFLHRKIDKLFGFEGVPNQRRVLSVVFSYGGEVIRVTTAHMDAAGSMNHRLQQHHYLLNSLRKKPKITYEIICGDFNTLRGRNFDKEIQSIRTLYKKNNLSEVCSDSSYTQDMYYCDFSNRNLKNFIKKYNIHYRQKLDHIWHKGFTIHKVETLVLEGSDHLPLIATIDFKKK